MQNSTESAALQNTETNTSGMGKNAVIPEGVKGWSWGAFFLNWIWAISNKTWIGLLCLIPYVGFVMSFFLGAKGREWAWRNKRWESVEHFNRVQKKWSFWGVVLVAGIAGLGIVAAIAIPAYVDYQHHVQPVTCGLPASCSACHCDYLTNLSGRESFRSTLPVFPARRIISWLPVIQVKSAFCISSDQAKWC